MIQNFIHNIHNLFYQIMVARFDAYHLAKANSGSTRQLVAESTIDARPVDVALLRANALIVRSRSELIHRLQ